METTRAGIAIYKINYQSDFILTVVCDVEWGTPFCIKFWTGEPSQAYYVGWTGTEYKNCKVVESDPSKLLVLFDDHHLPVGELKMQIVYHTTIEDFPNAIVDEVTNSMKVMAFIDGKNQKIALDFEGEEAAELQFELPAYANEAQRIANEEQRIANEQARIEAEQQRIDNEQTRQDNEAQRIAQETDRVNEYAELKADAVAATDAANDAATLANQKAQLAADKAALADAAATLANQKAQLAADKAALADAAATLANQKAEYADAQGDYAKEQGDYAKDQGDTALADHRRAESDHETAASDHTIAENDHTQAGNDHTRAESDHSTAADDHTLAASDHSTAAADHTLAASDHSTAADDHTLAASDHSTAANDHTQAGNDHTRAESDHTRAESDHAAVEVYVDSLGSFDISSYHATGGVLAKYADLTAALGTNGANIPEAIRKGGMSVKFVHSSDNKYVQYFCKSQSFTINVADWEKMNLDEEIIELNQTVNGISVSELSNPGTSSSYWKNNNGVVGYAASGMGLHRADYINVISGSVLYITSTYGGARVAAFIFADNSDNVIEEISGAGNDPYFTYTIVPQEATRLYLNYLSSYNVEMLGSLRKIDQKINNLCRPYIQNRGVNAETGAIELYGNADHCLTNFIDVSDIPFVSYDLIFGSTSYNLISAFNENFEYIADNSIQPDTSWTEKSGIWTRGANTKYIIIGHRKSYTTHRYAFCANPLPTPGAVTESFVSNAVSAGIDLYKEQYGALKEETNTTPMSLSESNFELGNLQGGTGAPISADNCIRSTVYYPVVSEDKLHCSTSNNYRISIFEYKGDKSYTANGSWKTGSSEYQLSQYTKYIRIVIASPSGISSRPVWNDAAPLVTPGLKYVPTRAAALDETDISQYELPIVAPNPQLSADGGNDSDFNAETLTPLELYNAFDAIIASMQKPNSNVKDFPKFGTKYSKVGRDSTNTYDINAYVFGKRNRYGWKAGDALFAWKNGNTLLYTDSVSPRVGDTLYSDANRSSSGKTVSAFNASSMSIVASDSVSYSTSENDNIPADIIYTQDVQRKTSPYISLEVYNKADSLLSTAIPVDADTISYNQKNYVRCEDFDYHTKHRGTIVLWGNEHGPQSDPAECAIILYRLAKDLCNGCSGNQFLSWLKENFMFILIPCVNPYGLVHKTRENGSGVNLNRNYSTPGWAVVSDANKGTYAGDQPETQFVMNVCSAMHPVMAIDIHCLGYVTADNEGRVHYEGKILSQWLLNKAIDTLNGFSFQLSSYGNADPSTKSHGADWLTYHNIVGGLIEMNAGPYSTTPNGEQHSAHIMVTDYTLLLNMIRVWLQEWDENINLSHLFIR